MADCPECDVYKSSPARYRWCANQNGDLVRTNRWRYGQGLPPHYDALNTIGTRLAPNSEKKSNCAKNPKKISDGVPLVLEGPGTELAAVLHLLGVRMKENCGCKKMMFQMNAWGLDECQKRFDEIVKTIQDKAKGWGWEEQMTAWTSAGWNYLKHPQIWAWVNPLDPIPGLVKFAFHLWEQKQKGASP